MRLGGTSLYTRVPNAALIQSLLHVKAKSLRDSHRLSTWVATQTSTFASERCRAPLLRRTAQRGPQILNAREQRGAQHLDEAWILPF